MLYVFISFYRFSRVSLRKHEVLYDLLDLSDSNCIVISLVVHIFVIVEFIFTLPLLIHYHYLLLSTFRRSYLNNSDDFAFGAYFLSIFPFRNRTSWWLFREIRCPFFLVLILSYMKSVYEPTGSLLYLSDPPFFTATGGRWSHC